MSSDVVLSILMLSSRFSPETNAADKARSCLFGIKRFPPHDYARRVDALWLECQWCR